jgi:hypothetical protein
MNSLDEAKLRSQMFIKVLFFSAWLVSPAVILACVFSLQWLAWGAVIAFGLHGFTPYALPLFVLGPFLVLYLAASMSRLVEVEMKLIEEVGESRALWFKPGEGFEYRGDSVVKRGASALVLSGWDLTGPSLVALANMAGLPETAKQKAAEGILVVASLLWCRVIRLIDSWLKSKWVWAFYWSMVIVYAYRLAKTTMRLIGKIFWVWMAVTWVLLFVPNATYARLAWGTLKWVWAATQRSSNGGWLFGEWLMWRFTALTVDLVLFLDGLNFAVKSRHSAALSRQGKTIAAEARVAILRSVKFITDVALPEFIRRRLSWKVNMRELEASRHIMEELGWPINVSPAPVQPVPAGGEKWNDWLVGGSDFASGIRRWQLYVEDSLDELRATAAVYQRTEAYQSESNELEATSRYFQNKEVSGMPTDVDAVWEVIGEIFRHSRLTTFNTIISLWNKRYALGFWMAKENKKGKRSRKSFITEIGYSRFKALWARTFHRASQMLPVSHISVKGEPLPEKKWKNGLVRSIVGSSISQYILSTIFSHGPNHAFAWDTTPIKVGMPLNGYWMSRLFQRHARYGFHIEGDFTAFDSTLCGPVIDMIRAIRKRGYAFHKDRVRIAELIDINYDQVEKQVLGFTSTGNLYSKGTGLSTGHASTSMDNSIACVTFYLMAWKSLTGKTAREFLHYNELSCFGDDHILSVAHDRPRVWTAKNIREVMSKWGVTNNVEVKPLSEVAFLSKRCRRATPRDRREAEACGVRGIQQIVWHDRTKLLGKLTAPLKMNNPTYRVTRLLSYLTLTAHHPDIYEGICKAFKQPLLAKALKASGKDVPSYESVMRAWYNPSPGSAVKDPDPEDVFVNDGAVLTYGTPTLFDHFLEAFSQVPDLLNPVNFNFGIMRGMQARLAPSLAWVADLIATQNGAVTPGMLSAMAKPTPYSCFDFNIIGNMSSGVNPSTLLVRHWLYTWYCFRFKPGRLSSWADFYVRKVANWQFMLNGAVQRDLPRPELAIDRIVVAALLALIWVPDLIPQVMKLRLPDLGMWFELLINRILSMIWSNVPVNFGELNHTLDKGACYPLLVSAPTGTGKSTQLVYYLSTATRATHTRVVVLEPRSMLVRGLVPFTRSFLGLNCSGSTTGLDLDPTARVWYMTPQAFFGQLVRMRRDFLYVVDEAHLNEPAVVAARSLLTTIGLDVVLLTATPTDALKAIARVEIDIPIAKLWDVSVRNFRLDSHEPVKEYIRNVQSAIHSFPPYVKVAVMVDTPAQAESLRLQAPRRSQAITGRSLDNVDPDASFYFCTSVIDVGVTIPDIDFLLMPSWKYAGENKRWALSQQDKKQRMGRVGRTKNGQVWFYEASDPFPSEPIRIRLTAEEWRPLVATGFPVPVLNRLDKHALAEVLHLDDTNISDEDWQSVVRGSAIFLSNMAPMISTAIHAVETGNDLGQPVSLHPTDMGRFSSSFIQDLESSSALAIRATAAVVKKGMGMTPEPDEAGALIQLNSVAGPTIKVANLAFALSSDLASGFSDMLNPKNAVAQSLDAVRESAKIIALLNEVSQMS